MNKFHIEKQKTIIAEIPRVETDPLALLRERMQGRQGHFEFNL